MLKLVLNSAKKIPIKNLYGYGKFSKIPQMQQIPKYNFFGNNNKNNNNDNEDLENQAQGFNKFKRRQKSADSNKKIHQKKQVKQEEFLEENENSQQQQQEEQQEQQGYKRQNFSEKLNKLNKKVCQKIDKQAQKNQNEYEIFDENKIQNNRQNLQENQQQQQQQEEGEDQLEKAQGFEKFKRRRKNSPQQQQNQQNQNNKELYEDLEKKLSKEEETLEKEQEQLEKKIKEVKENLTKEEEYRRRSQRIYERSKKLKEKLDPIKSEEELKQEKENQENQENEEKLRPKGFTQNEQGFFNKKKKDDKKSSQQKPKMFREEGEKNSNNDQNSQKQNQDPQQPKFNKWLLLSMAVLGGFGIIQFFQESEFGKKPISYTEFMKIYLEKGNVDRISIKRKQDQKVGSAKTYAKIFTKDGDERSLEINHLDHFLQVLEQTQVKQGKTPDQYIVVDFNYTVKKQQVFDKLLTLFLVGANIYIFYLMFKGFQQMKGLKGGGGMGDMMGPSKVKVYGLDTKLDIKFKDVAGQEEAKQEIMEFVDFLKNSKKYTDLGASIPKGALLSGPPGTGKTLLAKACAGEAGVPFFFMAGSDFVEMFVGVGSQRVRDLFKQAKAKQPSIIFIDEIDAIGKKRNNSGRGNDERENTLNQMLVEMDGFGTSQQVVVLAATNRADMLDPALLRPGRFDRKIEVSLPDIDGRKEIFLVHLKNLKLDLAAHTKEDYAKRLATLTPGFSGADIANLCNEAALITARKNKDKIQTIDFEMASERVMAGIEKKNLMHKEERRVIAVHEAGHAVVGWFLEGGSPLIKVTIIPRSKGSLGYAQYLPNEGSLQTEQELYDQICAALGGRVAEEVFFGRITNGAANDLEKVYKMAQNMVVKLGMSQKIGYIGFKETNGGAKVFSKETNKMIDDEIKRIIHEQTERCRQLIMDKKQEIEALSEALLEKETLDLKQIKEIIGERPFEAKSNYKAYLEQQEQLEKEVEQQKSEEKKLNVEENIDPDHNQNEKEFEKRDNDDNNNNDNNNQENNNNNNDQDKKKQDKQDNQNKEQNKNENKGNQQDKFAIGSKNKDFGVQKV